MKYRIKKVTFKDGTQKFFPQRKLLWFWEGDKWADSEKIAQQCIDTWIKESKGKVTVEYIEYPKKDFVPDY